MVFVLNLTWQIFLPRISVKAFSADMQLRVDSAVGEGGSWKNTMLVAQAVSRNVEMTVQPLLRVACPSLTQQGLIYLYETEAQQWEGL